MNFCVDASGFNPVKTEAVIRLNAPPLPLPSIPTHQKASSQHGQLQTREPEGYRQEGQHYPPTSVQMSSPTPLIG